MHFATFAGSDVEAAEPILELGRAREKYGISDWKDDGGFGTIHVGETAVIPLRAKDA
jgi:N-acyl-phosphatidylethanolamine-hydrolysing phospholipase D